MAKEAAFIPSRFPSGTSFCLAGLLPEHEQLVVEVDLHRADVGAGAAQAGGEGQAGVRRADRRWAPGSSRSGRAR